VSLKFIYGRSGSGKTTYCIEEIKNKLKEDKRTPLILLVPEQYTFQAEKRLSEHIDKDPYFRARVLSFKTMSNIVFTECGGLTHVYMEPGGRVMLIYKIIEKLKDELKIFSTAASQQGFVSNISDIISELKQYKISPEELRIASADMENEFLKSKLQDISKIYEEFENRLHEKYIDSQDALDMLAKKLEDCTYFNNAEIYIDEFTGFTPSQYSVVEKLLQKTDSVNMTLVTDVLHNGASYDKTEVFARTNFTEEKLVKLCSKINVKIEKPINLNENSLKRFKDNIELSHLEKYYHAYPYRSYKNETSNICVFEATNLYSEVEETAKDIIRLVREKNIRYRDITVATRDLNRYSNLIESIFNEYDIPSFIDEKREVKSNPIVVIIVSALEMYSKRYNYESVFRYLKSGLIGIDRDDISLIENYVLANDIKGKKWLEDKWNYRLDYNLENDISEYESYVIEKVNETKSKIMPPILKFHGKLIGRNKVKDICKYVYEFLIDADIPNILELTIEYLKNKDELDTANQYSQVWDIVVDILDQMVEIMGDEWIPLDQYIKIITSGFEEYEIGVVPPTLDQVLVSSVDRMKNTNTKYFYLLGTNDGIFPLSAKDNGLLNDMDREKLSQAGVEVDIDSKTKTFEEQFLVYKALTLSSEYMRVSYPIADHEGKTLRPSIIISRLKKLFPNIKMETDIIKPDINKDEDILKLITRELPTFNEMIKSIKSWDETDYINNIWLDVYKYYIDSEKYSDLTSRIIEGIYYTNQVESVDVEKLKKLYGDKMYFSVSRLEKYAQCPFAYFVQYGLKAKERKVYSFSAPDLGTFMHNVLDKFSNSIGEDNLTWKDIDNKYIENKISDIVDTMISKIPGYILESSARYKYLSRRLKTILISAIQIIAEQIKKGSFEPLDYEVGFGYEEKYPPIKIVLETGEEIDLRGRIDRVDIFEKEDERYIRIVDYKTGNKSLSLSDIYYGLQLQLLVYLDAIIEGAKEEENNLNPAAILYFRIDDPIITAKENMEDESIKEAIMKKLKMKGLVVKDADIVKEMDHDLEENSSTSSIIPASIKKDGTLSSKTHGATYEEFDILRKYVKSTIKDLCEEMLSGNIMIKPYKKNKSTSCEYCEYSAICQFDGSIKDNKYRNMNDKKDDEVLELMRKAVEC
jgi:ATP-dependent helicase/nuclease subunit B